MFVFHISDFLFPFVVILLTVCCFSVCCSFNKIHNTLHIMHKGTVNHLAPLSTEKYFPLLGFILNWTLTVVLRSIHRGAV